MSDVFESNIARLVKQSALPLDDARRARARAEFLRAAEGPAFRPGWRLIGVAASVLIFCGVVVETTRSPLPLPLAVPKNESVARQNESPWIDIPGEGGNPVIRGSLRLAKRKGPTGSRAVEFKGRTTLPEGFVVRAHPKIMEEQLRGGVLSSQPKSQGPSNLGVEQGRFLFEQGVHVPALLRIDVDAPDHLQYRDVAAQTATTETDRACTFVYSVWDQNLLSQLEPQLEELATLAREGRDLVARVEAACAAEPTFREQENKLTAEASKLQARAQGLAENNFYPAAANALAYTLRDLATSLAIFKWKDGKFEGPVSYYTNGKPGKLHRGDEFSFEALRRYMDQAVLVSGREFDLWILRENRRAGASPELAAAVAKLEDRPGIKEFAADLKNLAPRRADLETEIRKISR